MDYVTLTEVDRERISLETVQGLPVNQFEKAIADEEIVFDADALKGLLHTYEADHWRQTIRATVGDPFPAPAGSPPAANLGQIEDLEQRIAVLKERLSL